MTTPPYRVERANPRLVQEAVVALWRGNLGAGIDLHKKYQWLYGEEAEQPGDIYLLYVSTQSTPVGACGLVPRRFMVPGRVVKAAVLSDLVVDKQHRTLFPAMLLQKSVVEDGGRRYDLIYGFPNANAKPLFRRLGYMPLGRMVRFTRIVNAKQKLKARFHTSIAAVLAPIANLVLAVDFLLKKRQGLECVKFNWNDANIELWPMSRIHQAAVHGLRDSLFLHHRYAKNPSENYELMGIFGPKNLFEGYAVVHTSQDVMHVDDLFVNQDKTAVALLALIREAKKRTVTSMHVEMLETPQQLIFSKSAGLLARENREIYYFTAGDAPLRNILSGSEAWFLTAADEDQ
ncbi:MAG: hypothetical protein AABY83_12125 [Pseudomonadota bacterium]